MAWQGGPSARVVSVSDLEASPEGAQDSMGEESEEDVLGALLSATGKDPVKLMQTHRTFFSNLKLSALVAAWITLFGAFSFQNTWREATFGDPCCKMHPELIGEVNFVCPGKPGGPQNYTVTWCGALPAAWLGSYSNVVEMIVFTVYQNTGTTIMQAWQGVIGTWVAVLNHWAVEMLHLKFGLPHDGWFVWADTLGFIFCVLVSGAQENTMKFSMNWHVWFMMSFITRGVEPAYIKIYGIPGGHWDSNTVSALITSTLGALIAVLATLLPPPPLTCYSKVETDAANVATVLRRIWGQAIDYFSRQTVSPECAAIAESIDHFNDAAARLQKDLSNSWWEGFDLCGRGRKRQLFRVFVNMVASLDDVTWSLKDSLMKEDFSGDHRRFMQGMSDLMKEIVESASNVLDYCVEASEDGVIEPHEREEMEGLVARLKEAQVEMLNRHIQIRGHIAHRTVNRDLADEHTIMFALSVWARKVTDCAENMLQIDDQQELQASWQGTLCSALWSGARKTVAMPTKDQVQFAVRNWLSISAVFIMGYALNCKDCVFGQSANMAGLLTLLINHYSGSAFLNNVKRLLGVLIGKVTPVLILGMLDPDDIPDDSWYSFMSCDSPSGSIVTAMIVFFFGWLFNYMYYTSVNWGLIGCLSAAYGCAALVKPCNRLSGNYTPKYKEFAQDLFAIMLGLVIDEVFDLLTGKAPRDSAVQNVQSVKESLLAGFAGFFEGDVSAMRASLRQAKGTISTAKALSYEADPALMMMPGPRTPFKINLYKESLRIFEILQSDLAILVFAVEDWTPEALPADGNDANPGEQMVRDEAIVYNIMSQLHTLPHVEQELTDSISIVFDTLYLLLAHSSEEAIENVADKRTSLRGAMTGFHMREQMINELDSHRIGQLVHREELKVHLQVTEDPREKLTVACQVLRNVKLHLAMLEKEMLKHITV